MKFLSLVIGVKKDLKLTKIFELKLQSSKFERPQIRLHKITVPSEKLVVN